MDLPSPKECNLKNFTGKLNLPLHKTGNVDARAAKTVNLPLHKTGDVYARAEAIKKP